MLRLEHLRIHHQWLEVSSAQLNGIKGTAAELRDSRKEKFCRILSLFPLQSDLVPYCLQHLKALACLWQRAGSFICLISCGGAPAALSCRNVEITSDHRTQAGGRGALVTHLRQAPGSQAPRGGGTSRPCLPPRALRAWLKAPVPLHHLCCEPGCGFLPMRVDVAGRPHPQLFQQPPTRTVCQAQWNRHSIGSSWDKATSPF